MNWHRSVDPKASIKTDRVTVYTASRDVLQAPSASHLWPDEFVTYEPKLDKRAALKAFKTNPDAVPEGFAVVKTESVSVR